MKIATHVPQVLTRRPVRSGSIAAVVAVAVLAAALLLGRGDDADRAGAWRGAASGDARAGAVIRDYTSYWTDLLAASNPPDARNAKLAAHATGTELERARTVLTARKLAGETVRGSFRHTAELVSISDAEAVVSDCLVARTGVYRVRDGKLTARDPQRPQPLTVNLRLEAGSWKVALIEPRSSSCTT